MNYDILSKKLIKNFKKNNFFGIDDYYSEKVFHPMSYGKYLESFEILINSNIYDIQSDLEITDIFQVNLKILKQSMNVFKNKKIGFGLSFEWKDFKENESFLITNLLIYKGLKEASFLKNKKELLENLKNILLNWPKKNNYFSYAYLNQNTKPVLNVMAKYLQFLKNEKKTKSFMNHCSLKGLFLKKNDELAFEYFLQSKNKKKKDNDTVYDLLHNLYIIESLIDIDDNHANLKIYKSILCNFINFDKKYNIIFFSDNALNKNLIINYNKRPRIWSIGVLIQVLTMLYQKGCFDFKELENFIISITKYIFSKFNDNELYSKPRQCAHLLHGLSFFLREKHNK